MIKTSRKLLTRGGAISFPAYIPVTTFGTKYPLDSLIRPYLPRLAPAVMVSYYYARQMMEPLRLPLMVDSGGFASLFEGSRIVRQSGLGVLHVRRNQKSETIHPSEVLELQETIADVAFPLDFPIPPGADLKEARRRQQLTIANAQWALANRRRKDLPLFAPVQAWDAESARESARQYRGAGFDGIAIGGLVPRARDLGAVLAIIEAVRNEVNDLPLHVFGLGKPEVIEALYQAGVDSVDSSSYVKLAADGRLWSKPDYRIIEPTPSDRLHLALCNLATATGQTLPLSAARVVFATHNLMFHAHAAPA
jgi:tRNA-guanine family transglycosylase